MAESRLQMALRHVVNGRRIITAQERRIAGLRADGRDCSSAEALLATYQTTQAIFEDELEGAYAEAKAQHVLP